METSKAPLSNLALKEDPELCFHAGKIFPEEGFITLQKALATWLGPSLLSVQPHLLTALSPPCSEDIWDINAIKLLPKGSHSLSLWLNLLP